MYDSFRLGALVHKDTARKFEAAVIHVRWDPGVRSRTKKLMNNNKVNQAPLYRLLRFFHSYEDSLKLKACYTCVPLFFFVMPIASIQMWRIWMKIFLVYFVRNIFCKTVQVCDRFLKILNAHHCGICTVASGSIKYWCLPNILYSN